MVQRYFALLNDHWQEVDSCLGEGWFATVKDESIVINKLGYDGYALYDLACGRRYVDCALSDEIDEEEFEQHLNSFLDFCTTLLETSDL